MSNFVYIYIYKAVSSFIKLCIYMSNFQSLSLHAKMCLYILIFVFIYQSLSLYANNCLYMLNFLYHMKFSLHPKARIDNVADGWTNSKDEQARMGTLG